MYGILRYLLYGANRTCGLASQYPFQKLSSVRPSPANSLPRAYELRMTYKFLIVDDNSSIRSALRSWIEGNPYWEVCGEAENGQIAVEMVEQMRPDVVLLDLQMPVMDGLEAARQINRRAPQTAMLMLTLHRTRELLKAALEAGVRDVV